MTTTNQTTTRVRRFDLLECEFDNPTANTRYEIAVTAADSAKQDPAFYGVFDSRCMTCADGNVKIKVSHTYYIYMRLVYLVEIQL